MASRAPHMMSLTKFMLRSEVLKLYRSMLRVVRRIPDKSQQKELVEWIRHDFTANKHLEDEDAIKMMITKGKQSMRELEQKLKSVIATIKGKMNTNTPLRTSPRVVCTFVICGCIIFQTGVLFFSVYNPLRTIIVERVHELLKNGTGVQIPELNTFIEVMDEILYNICLIKSNKSAGYNSNGGCAFENQHVKQTIIPCQ
ncbi:Hypothetical predicted protein [Mytilus galloprovincialis]|uniref:LYR motif-containing protein 2 n=1 Tax=Mytilus galloprovincialis TaxID=29158 RepID=A0A8B6F3L1_MYTGA|nr:Hypothetical predicted protein [Mytilus galloprovincialis]